MPQAANKPTKREERLQAAEKAAKDHVKGYKPKSGTVFDGSRGFVEAQFEIMYSLQEEYEKMVEQRGIVREQLRALHKQGLLTKEEAVDLFTVFPHRERPGAAADTTEASEQESGNDGGEEAAQAA